MDNKPVSLVVGTDIHYISPELTDHGELFMNMVENADGKLTEYSEEILGTFVEKAAEIRPDAVILCGDLTYNGEMRSLLDLKEELLKLQEDGIRVLVIPGNHDIACPYARRFEKLAFFQTDNISQAQFREIMGCFGYDDALTRDEGSFSYLYALRDDLYLLFLDANTEEAPGSLRTETLIWAEEALKKAKEDGAKVISVTHQNVLAQSDILSAGYTIDNHYAAASMLRKYGVSLNLSGHSHLQHTAAEDGLTDICTGSMAVSPLRYGTILITDNSEAAYTKQDLGILREEAEARFSGNSREQITAVLAERDIPAEVREKMCEFAMRLNREYFAGDLGDKEDYIGTEEWNWWKTYGNDTFWYVYFCSMFGVAL